MSKTTFSFDTDLKGTTLSKAENKSRLLKIQQKLQAITLQRQNHAKDQLQEQLTRRITDLQFNSAEEIKQMESKVRMLREELGQMRLKESQFIKKMQLARKTRNIQIAEIHKKLASLLSFQSKDRKDIESALARSIELKTDALLKDLKQAKQARIQRINELQERLQTQMPQKNLDIREGYSEIQEQLEQVHRKVKEQAADFREKVQNKQGEREKTAKSIMLMINNTVQEIKAELEQQKIARNKSKQQLLALFNSAYGKLNPHQ